MLTQFQYRASSSNIIKYLKLRKLSMLLWSAGKDVLLKTTSYLQLRKK
jgi:hypothetical protein